MSSPRKEKTIGKTLGLVLLLVVPVLCPQTKAQTLEPEPELTKDRPLLEVDLKQYGYKPHVPFGRHDYWSLAFADTDDLVLGWTTLDNNGDKKKGYLTPAPSHLHALVINVRTGEKKTIKAWPTSTFYATINPVSKGKFFTCTGNAIQLLSDDFGLIREEHLSRFGPCNSDDVSLSRRSFSIDTGVGRDSRHTLIDAESFEPLATWSNEVFGVHFTDNFLVGTCRPHFELCIRGISEQWQPFNFPEMNKQLRDSKGKTPFFANDSTLVLTAGGKMAVVTLEGVLLFQVSLPSKYSFGSEATSAGGERFAIIETKIRGVTNEVLDMYGVLSDDHVVVYSLHERTAIYACKVKGSSPWPPWIEHRNRLALSPDGALLAVLDDGILEVYQLPKAKSR
ncbi:MAG: hypothetical protein JWO71_3228 [Candidatus Acidoferrum typicum]|nr:hypothetical protein [Candidatus Acidoferrum typicum]